MSSKPTQIKFSLLPADNQRLANLCGQLDEHIKQIEGELGVQIDNRGNVFRVTGRPEVANYAKTLLKDLYDATTKSLPLTPSGVHSALQQQKRAHIHKDQSGETELRTPKLLVHARNPRQEQYIRNILTHDIRFCRCQQDQRQS